MKDQDSQKDTAAASLSGAELGQGMGAGPQHSVSAGLQSAELLQFSGMATGSGAAADPRTAQSDNLSAANGAAVQFKKDEDAGQGGGGGTPPPAATDTNTGDAAAKKTYDGPRTEGTYNKALAAAPGYGERLAAVKQKARDFREKALSATGEEPKLQKNVANLTRLQAEFKATKDQLRKKDKRTL